MNKEPSLFEEDYKTPNTMSVDDYLEAAKQKQGFCLDELAEHYFADVDRKELLFWLLNNGPEHIKNELALTVRYILEG
jgi:hypothetical protein